MNCCKCKKEIAVAAMENACGAFCFDCNNDRVAKLRSAVSGETRNCLWCGVESDNNDGACRLCERVRDRLPRMIAHGDHLLRYVLARYKWKAEDAVKPTTNESEKPTQRRGYWAGVWTAIMGGAR